MGTITSPQKDNERQLNPLQSERGKITFMRTAGVSQTVVAALQTLLFHSSRFSLVWEKRSCRGSLRTKMISIHFAFLYHTSVLLAGLSAVQFHHSPTHFPTEFKDHLFQGFSFVIFFSPWRHHFKWKIVHPRSSPSTNKRALGTPWFLLSGQHVEAVTGVGTGFSYNPLCCSDWFF